MRQIPKWTRRVTPQAGDLIFSYEATLNLYAIIPKGLTCCLGRRMGLIRIDPNQVDGRYLYYYFFSDEWRNLIASKTIIGATVDRLPILAFPDFEVSLPPLPIQRRIASVLGAYDDLIENSRRRIALLEKMARELYRERFVRRAGKGKTLTLGKIGIRLETGTRPKGGIKDISEGVPSVGAENVIGLGQYNFASEKLVSEEFFKAMKRGVINDRDILLYKDGAYIGRVSLFQDGFPHKRAAVNEHVFLLHSNDEDLQYFLFFTLAQEKYFKIMQCLNENAAQPGLNQGAVLGLKVVLPPKKEVLVFDSQVAPMVAEIFNLALQNRSLTRQRDRLLPRLMSGKIDVVALVKEEERHG